MKVTLKYDIFFFKPSEVSDLILSYLRRESKTGQGSGLAYVGWGSLPCASIHVTADQCLKPVWIDAIYSNLLVPGWGVSEFLFSGRSIPSRVPEWNLFSTGYLEQSPFLDSVTHIHTHTHSNWVAFCSSQRELAPGISVWRCRIYSLATLRCSGNVLISYLETHLRRLADNLPERHTHPQMLLHEAWSWH